MALIVFNYSRVWLFPIGFITLRVGGINNIIFTKLHSLKSSKDSAENTFLERKTVCLDKKIGMTIELALCHLF